MSWVANQEDTLDGVEGVASEAWKSIDSCSGALGVSLEDKTLAGITRQRGMNMVDDLNSSTIISSILHNHRVKYRR